MESEEEIELQQCVEKPSRVTNDMNIGQKHKRNKRTILAGKQDRLLVRRVKRTSDNNTGTKETTAEEPELPYLEICIQHSGCNHDDQNACDVVTYKYKDAEGNMVTIDVEATAADNNECDFTFEENGKVYTIERSTINRYRKESDYYGPLRVVQHREEIKDNEALKEVHIATLEPVDFAVTRKEDRSVSEQELDALMNHTPGIIPPSKKAIQNEYTVLRKDNKKYRLSKRAFNFLEEQVGGSVQNLDSTVEEIFLSSEKQVGLVPVTIIRLFQKKKKKKRKGPGRISSAGKKKSVKKKKRKVIRGEREERIYNYYNTDYLNWSRRGNVYFTELKKTGINFIDELVAELPVQDDLKELSESFSSTSDDNQIVPKQVHSIETSHFQAGSKEYAEDIWHYFMDRVKRNDQLIKYEYDMENEKWVELRRAFNVFKINGEVVSDIFLKVVLQEEKTVYSVVYFLRCLNRLVKQGLIQSKIEVNYLLRCFSEDKYTCIGIDKEKYIYQCDENELLRHHLKENGQLSLFPFEAIRDRHCKAIVTDTNGMGNFKFERGKSIILGPLCVCKPCVKLSDKLEELLDPSIRVFYPRQETQRLAKQRYGPVQNIKISQSIRKLCLETAGDFVKNSSLENENFNQREAANGGMLSKKLKLFDLDTDLSQDDRPSIKFSECEFENMLKIKKSSQPHKKLTKICDKCGFEAQSMLSLFLHMGDHIGTTIEECVICGIKLSGKEAVVQHNRTCHGEESSSCAICQNHFSSREELFIHMNCHRSCRPYVCLYCDQRHQTVDLYKKHMKQVHHMERVEEMNFICKVCSSHFVTYDHLHIHRLNLQHHSEKETLKCKICTFSCNLISVYCTHLLTHTFEQREYHNIAMCHECKKAFFSTFELEDHKKREHGNIVIHSKEVILPAASEIIAEKTVKCAKTFTCMKCSKVYATQNALQKHLENSHPEKTVQEEPATSSVQYSCSCNNCGMKFTSEYFLNIHMNFHTSNTRASFPCEDVGYMYCKRTEAPDHMIRGDQPKHADKQQQLVHQQHQQQQQQQISSYGHVFAAHQQQPDQTSFTGNQIPGIAGQTQVMHAAEATWNQQQNPANMDETHDSVYSLLHL